MSRSSIPANAGTSHTARVLSVTLVLGVLLSPLAAASAAGQSGESVATLTGRVVSAMTGGPLRDVRVVLQDSRLGTFTDSTGRFSITGIPPGPDTVDVSLIGFAQQSAPIHLKAGHVTRVTFLLSESVLKMEDITVTVERRDVGRKLAEFRERKKKLQGYYVTPEMVEQRNAQHTSDLLRMVPGVAVGAYRMTGTHVRMTRGGDACEPVYYVDGTLSRTLNVDQLNSEDILAIEVYRGPAETPVRYMTNGSSCGTILLWTQEAGPKPADDGQ